VTATEGSLLPSGVWKSAALHIDIVAIGLGVIPFLLGAAWVYSNLRGGAVPARAFAVFTGIALPLLVLETASYDVRFGGPDVIRDRYLLYLSPLLFLATAAALVGRLPVWGIVGSTAFFVATVALADFPAVAGIYVDSAVTVLNGVIRDVSPGLRPGNFVAVCGIVLGAVCVGLKWVPRPVAMLGVTLFVFAFTASLTGYAFERLLTSHTPAGVPVTGQSRVRDWIDHQADGRSVALIAYPISRSWGQSAVTWWDAEFWNHSVPTSYVGTNGRWTYDPFPSPPLRFGPDGVVAGSKGAPKLVLVAPNDSRFGLAAKQVASNAGLALLKASRPWRADWASRGLDPDGWTRPERPAAIRVFAGKNRPTERVNVSLAVDAPPEAKTETRFVAGGAPGSVAPGARAGADVSVCVPAGGHADIPLRSDPAARIDGPPIGPAPGPARKVGVVLSSVQVSRTGNAC
jgi:hypothetical protein